MNKKVLAIGFGIMIISNLLIIISVSKMQIPYSVSLIIFTIISVLLWFLFLNKEVPLSIKGMDTNTFKATLPLLAIVLSTFIFIVQFETVDSKIVASLFITSSLVGIYEEIIFRGIAQGSFLSAGMKPFKAILLSSILFSLFHISYVTDIGFTITLQLLNTFMMGFILGYIYFKTKNILFVIAVHIFWDLVIFMNQKFSSEKAGLVIAIILFATTFRYFIWGFMRARGLEQ